MVTSRYRYDDGGNRIYKDAQGNKEYYFRDDLGHEVAVYDMTTDRPKTINLYGSDPVGRIDLSWTSQYDYEFEQYVWLRSDSRKYYVKDHLGSIRQTLSESGVVMSATDYYAFGGTMSSYINGSTIDKYKFTGKERDTETGLDYFGARYFDSKIGRWMSVDPLADKYPEWSPYNYCFNNPLMLIDPDGREIKVKKDKNEDGSIHYTITYTATIVNESKDVTNEQLGTLKDAITKQIEKSFTGSKGKVSWEAVVDIQYGGQARDGDNIIRVADLPPGDGGSSLVGGNTQTISSAIIQRNDVHEMGRTGAHEFGHGAGLDHYGRNWKGGTIFSGQENRNPLKRNLMQQSDVTPGTKINYNQIKQVIKYNKK